ncbi:hypothetical protein BC939DRAFT_497657, partial [Gamsiella multidivaricata]|uniref:uncharacterized protein n=1 Tax=Gamsiella multidivaricata TaxID=101098 RepID=UPI00221FF0B2
YPYTFSHPSQSSLYLELLSRVILSATFTVSFACPLSSYISCPHHYTIHERHSTGYDDAISNSIAATFATVATCAVYSTCPACSTCSTCSTYPTCPICNEIGVFTGNKGTEKILLDDPKDGYIGELACRS